jgi:hypothetical protein
MMRGFVKVCFGFLLAAWAITPSLRAQAIPRNEYIKYLPLDYPRLYEQTPASKKFSLFGDIQDPGYRDAAPKDGMDDSRARILQGLAVRFAPIMVQNTTQIPMDFKKLMRIQGASTLYVDSWDLSHYAPTLVNKKTFDYLAFGSDGDDAEAVLKLLQEFHPEHPRNESFNTMKRPGTADLFKVFFFDWAGDGPESWKAEYEDGFTQRLQQKYQNIAKSYVHPFITELESDTGGFLGYEFVLQYWFFYPMNDGGNNHEGDWEHINVIITPRKRVSEGLSESDVIGILQGKGLVGDPSEGEELVIKRVEYCMHHIIFMMDYSLPNVYLPRDEWRSQVEQRIEGRRGEEWIWERARERAYMDGGETRINTHPLCFIGGDDKGFDQILAMPGGKNRDSHGTFPFPGTFKQVGPAGASEQIRTWLDLEQYFLTRDEPNAKFKKNAFKRNGILELGTPERIEIVPDWERVIDLVQKDPEARKEWSWLVLPIRWGYPATESPAAGIVSYADTGNSAIVGPAFTGSWNKTGGSPGYEPYVPHVFPALTPLDIQDNFLNELGFLNAVIPILSLPPLDVLTRVVAFPFTKLTSKRRPIFMAKEKIPSRFYGFSLAYSTQSIPDNFSYLLYYPEQLFEIYLRLLELDPDYGTIETREDLIVERATGASFNFSIYIGKRFVTENTISNSRSSLGQDLYLTNRGEPFAIRSDLNLWEYMGSLRFNLATGNLQPFIKAGYGFSWYRLENINTDGIPLTNPSISWVKKFPWHLGGGIEFNAVKSSAPFPGGIDIGLRADYLLISHNLGFPFNEFNLFEGIDLKNVDLRVNRHRYSLALSISF